MAGWGSQDSRKESGGATQTRVREPVPGHEGSKRDERKAGREDERKAGREDERKTSQRQAEMREAAVSELREELEELCDGQAERRQEVRPARDATSQYRALSAVRLPRVAD